jgi:two-component system NarL family sensor kinase
MDLRAAPLQEHTLPEALAELVANGPVDYQPSEIQSRPPQVQFTCSQATTIPMLPAQLEVGLYRIAQEALTNAYRHAEAQHIEVTLTVDEEQVCLTVQDDGKGFATESVVASGGVEHFGLTGMSERVRLLHGTICIQSEPGAGTYIDVAVPFSGKERHVDYGTHCACRRSSDCTRGPAGGAGDAS